LETKLPALEHSTNAELLSKLAGKNAAHALMQHYGGLVDLAKASFDELQNVKGVGQSKAAAIKSAFLLAQRLSQEVYPESPVMENSEQIAGLLREQNLTYPVENFQVVFLNTRRRVIGVQTISQGTLDTILVHPREVFAAAISRRASAIVLAHNHPSGDPAPSEADIRATRDMIRAGQLLNIPVVDHVILGRATPERPKDFSSLRDLGYFYADTGTGTTK
jgi:DNA repair protein RadC